MSNDWRRRIDEWKSQQAEVTPQQRQEKWQSAYEHNLREFQHHFKCHICGRLPEQPKTRGNANGGEWDNWNIPDDLWPCEICKQWTCHEHIYKGICQKDAEKL
jgi:hypothetical protein